MIREGSDPESFLHVPPNGHVHGACVAVARQGCLILGPPGSGKSSLALLMMGFGAGLVADDQVILSGQEGVVWAAVPDMLLGMIEARGVGILAAEAAGAAPIKIVVDLSQPETVRLPPRRKIAILGHPVDLVRGQSTPVLAAALVQYLRSGRRE